MLRLKDYSALKHRQTSGRNAIVGRPAQSEYQETSSAEDCWSDEIAKLDSLYGAFKFLKTTTAEFGFERFSVVEVPWEEVSIATVMILNNWDPEFIQAYDELELAKNSPIFRHVRKSVQPLVFDVEDIQKSKPTAQRQSVMTSFRDFGRTKGVILPVFCASGLRGAVCFTGRNATFSKAGVHALHLRSLYLFEQIIRVRDADNKKQYLLSEREKQCLQWTAIGKTSAEVAVIIDISENTVNHHLSAVCKKLEATNRTHAVAKALRKRLID